MKRQMAAGAAALALGLTALASGCGSVNQAAAQPAGGGLRVAAGAAPCSSGYFPALRTAAAARLPVPATEVAAAQVPGAGAGMIGRALGVTPDVAALTVALPRTAAAGSPLAVRAKGGSATWTFMVDARTARLVVQAGALSGAALTAAQAFAPAWPGGSVQYQFTFPSGSLNGAPTLAGYLQRFATAVAAGQVYLTVVTGGTPKPAPTQYRAYWGPVDLGAIAAPGSDAVRCSAWRTRTLYAYRQGALTPISAEMTSIGNGGFVGFADGRFAVESAHAGVDTTTWYAVPGLRLPG